MTEKYNQKAIIAGLILIIIGILSILLDIFLINTIRMIWISIGCSLLASGIVILLQSTLVNKKEYNCAEEWGLVKIYKTRYEKSDDSDENLENAIHHLDVVAFGLKSFRSMHTKKVLKVLQNGVNIRILTMNPSENNPFLKQREKEENEPENQIRNSILELIKWANDLNQKNYTGSIEVRGYKCMTLDFYWRVDNDLYIGPYWYNVASQQTITYRFSRGKPAFDLYTDYFEKLWEDEENTVRLTGVGLQDGQ